MNEVSNKICQNQPIYWVLGLRHILNLDNELIKI